MVRMKDVLRSARDVVRITPKPDEEANENTTFRFPNSSPPVRQEQSPIAKPVEPVREQSNDEPRFQKLADEPRKQSVTDNEPALPKKDLYHSTISVIDEFLNSVKKDEPLNLDDIETQANHFVDSLYTGDQLFMQALSTRRTMVSLAQHTANVAIIAIKVGMGNNYNREKLVEVGIAGMVHEVGMMKIPNEIVTKKSELSPSEYEIIKQHPILGKSILESIQDEYPFLPAVIVQEHERWNGNGYPFGLKENEIHEYAQIIGMADTFVALTHLRHYRDNFIAYKAIQSIIERRNIDFSAKMIKSLIEVISIFPVHSLVKLNDGSVARVIQTNKNYPVRPVIQVIKDARGIDLYDQDNLDLSKEPMIYIVSPVLDESAYS